jgi:hypothetical protein
MTDQQVQLFLLFGVVFGLLVWGRIRHDLVAAMGLFAAVILGLVPDEEAFSGFANPAVAIVLPWDCKFRAQNRTAHRYDGIDRCGPVDGHK